MPPDAEKNQKAWERLLGPKWEVRRWTNADLTTSNFDSHVLDRVGEAPHGMQKADILRYHILSQEGGWYFDLDFEPIQSIEPLALALHRESLILCNEEEVMNGKISNGFLACTAGHPDMKVVAAAVLTQPLCNGPLDVAHIVSHTGPIFLYAALALANAYFLPSRLLYPISFSEILKRNSENHPYAFARHDWNPRYRLDATLYFSEDTEMLEADAAPPRTGGDPFAMLFCFVRDACQALRHWIPYHAGVFGMENIVILDHGSNEETKALIREYLPMGLRMYDVGSVPFTEKDLVLSRVMRKYKRYQYLIPLDSDEFLCLATTDGMACDRRRILDVLRLLPDRPVQYKLGTYEVCNTPEGEYADPWTEMSTFRYFPPETTEVFSTQAPSKSFYPGRYFVSTDAGNHHGHVDPDEGVWPTRLALAHFHTCGYRHFVSKHAQADLKLGVTDPDAHIGQRGNNWHWVERCMAIRRGRGRAYFETHICSLQGREEKALSDTLKQLARESAVQRP
jgi:hypothetical protein